MNTPVTPLYMPFVNRMAFKWTVVRMKTRLFFNNPKYLRRMTLVFGLWVFFASIAWYGWRGEAIQNHNALVLEQVRSANFKSWNTALQARLDQSQKDNQALVKELSGQVRVLGRTENALANNRRALTAEQLRRQGADRTAQKAVLTAAKAERDAKKGKK